MYHCPLKAFLNIHRKKLHQRIWFDCSHTTQLQNSIQFQFSSFNDFSPLFVATWEPQAFQRTSVLQAISDILEPIQPICRLLLPGRTFAQATGTTHGRRGKKHLEITGQSSLFYYFFPSQTAKHFLKAFMSFVCYRPIQQFKWLTRELST